MKNIIISFIITYAKCYFKWNTSVYTQRSGIKVEDTKTILMFCLLYPYMIYKLIKNTII